MQYLFKPIKANKL